MAMKSFLISLLLLFLSAHAGAEIVVIGNLQNSQEKLTTIQVQNIFMGRTRAFPDGISALPIDQLNLRAEFYQKLTQRPISQINAYWARLMFSGLTSPPVKAPNDQSVINMILENKGAIGYIDKINADTQSMRILLVLE